MLGLSLQNSLQQGWTYTFFAIFNAFFQVMWKPLVWPIIKLLPALNGPYLQSRGNHSCLKNRSNRYAGYWQNLFQLQPLWVGLYAFYHPAYTFSVFRLQPRLYQLPRMRWCQTLLAPHHSAGWPVILKCKSTKSASRSTVPLLNKRSEGPQFPLSANKALRLCQITLARRSRGQFLAMKCSKAIYDT